MLLHTNNNYIFTYQYNFIWINILGGLYDPITLSEVFEDENGKEHLNTLKVKELKKELKYGYQAVHDNCEPYEDNYTIHESTIYMNKETLIKRLISEGYKCIQDNQELTVFSKTLNKDYQRYDEVEIRKVIINTRGG